MYNTECRFVPRVCGDPKEGGHTADTQGMNAEPPGEEDNMTFFNEEWKLAT